MDSHSIKRMCIKMSERHPDSRLWSLGQNGRYSIRLQRASMGTLCVLSTKARFQKTCLHANSNFNCHSRVSILCWYCHTYCTHRFDTNYCHYLALDLHFRAPIFARCVIFVTVSVRVVSFDSWRKMCGKKRVTKSQNWNSDTKWERQEANWTANREKRQTLSTTSKSENLF